VAFNYKADKKKTREEFFKVAKDLNKLDRNSKQTLVNKAKSKAILKCSSSDELDKVLQEFKIDKVM